MLDPQTGLFDSDDGGQTVQPCPLAHLQEHHLVYFEMLGQQASSELLLASAPFAVVIYSLVQWTAVTKQHALSAMRPISNAPGQPY